MKPAMPRFSARTFLISLLFLFSLAMTHASLPGDEHWDSQFGPAGPAGQMFAVTTCKEKISMSEELL